jgi:hypothetical protein
MSRLRLAIDLITGARNYTLRLLESVPEADWFRQPRGGVTHIAWQVGHLAYAEYALAISRMRGPRREDDELLPEAFRDRFTRESVPVFDAARYPGASEIRAVFDRVHRQALAELPGLNESELDEPPLGKPHRIAKTKFLSLVWCAQHEAVHAGQIGLLRRQLGSPPLW